MTWWGRAGGVALAVAALAACDDNSTGPGQEVDGGTLMVDASAAPAYVRLGAAPVEVDPADPSASTDWDLSFFATAVTLNGGDAGPGEVVGVCLCQNEELTDAAVRGLTPADGAADFEAVTVAEVPSADSETWEGDTLDPVIEGWWSYDMATHLVSAVSEAVWKVRTAEGSGYAKLRVTDIANATQASAGEVTLEFAVQTEAGGAMGASQTLVVDVTEGPVHVDLLTGGVTDGSDWDLRLEGYTIQVNGGVSGEGEAGAVIVEESYDAITDASDLDGRRYAADTFGGVFASSEPGRGWYRYNLDGNHLIYPTYNVYLVRRGDDVWKVQLIGYYSDEGDERHVTLRAERLTD
ncbi:MAG TPA: HmuY family protein [Longimicrobiales bacterium]|nr:HmuY family protein [Longimicrobiales bacterium]